MVSPLTWPIDISSLPCSKWNSLFIPHFPLPPQMFLCPPYFSKWQLQSFRTRNFHPFFSFFHIHILFNKSYHKNRTRSQPFPLLPLQPWLKTPLLVAQTILKPCNNTPFSPSPSLQSTLHTETGAILSKTGQYRSSPNLMAASHLNPHLHNSLQGFPWPRPLLFFWSHLLQTPSLTLF